MIISLAADNCNDPSFTIPAPWFDDHTVRTEHLLQKRFRRGAQTTLDGGREILLRVVPAISNPGIRQDTHRSSSV